MLPVLSTGWLAVGDGHELFYEFCGAEGATKNAVFLHGGPGSGFADGVKRFFADAGYRVLFFDQRGSKRSRPFASLENNTTAHLVADIEKLREHMGVPQWDLCMGGSWGSTLSLAYAEAHPDRVRALIMWGIFTVRRKEIDWFYSAGAGAAFIRPEAHEEYLAHLSEAERADPLKSYYARLTSADEGVRLAAARAFSKWEGQCSSLVPAAASVAAAEEPSFAISRSRIEAHYFVNAGFMEKDGQLIAEAHKLRGIPTVIVQGRYDTVCPCTTAYELHKAWPESRLIMTSAAGHASVDPQNDAVLRAAVRMFGGCPAGGEAAALASFAIDV